MKAARSAKIKAEAGFSQTNGAGCWVAGLLVAGGPESMKAARSAKIKAEAGFSQTLSYKQQCIQH
jgi:hypothetical protein